jgi:hypothetical protein
MNYPAPLRLIRSDLRAPGSDPTDAGADPIAASAGAP